MSTKQTQEGLSPIAIHHLQDRAINGLEIMHVSYKEGYNNIDKLTVHRDDNYLFLLIEAANNQGSAILPAKRPIHLHCVKRIL